MRGGTGMALPILELGTRMGWETNATQPLHPLERSSIHCTGGWWVPASLHRYKKFHSFPPPPQGIEYQTGQHLASRY